MEPSSEYHQALGDTDPSGIYPEHSVPDNAISDSEENEVTYIVFVEPTDNAMLLIVSDNSMKEKDALSGR